VLLTVCFESGYWWLYAYILALEFIEVAEIGLGSIFRCFDVMDKYRRVEKSRPAVPIGENEVRITAKGMPRNYVAYAITLVEEKGASDIILKAMGRAISKAVTVAEILKRRIPGLHQTTEISSADVNYIVGTSEERPIYVGNNQTRIHDSNYSIQETTQHIICRLSITSPC
jgi:DNA-binding protein Alba